MTDTQQKSATRLMDRNFLEEKDPWALFSRWFAEAEASEPDNHNAMTLASVDAGGLPDARIVLLKSVSSEGFVFFTNTTSAKGHELETKPKAAIVFHWKSLSRQVRARGAIVAVSDAEADAYFNSRPRGAQIGAWASLQSQAMETPTALTQRIEDFEARYEGKSVPRPPHWSGYRLRPLSIEFWADRPFRLHDRLLFTKTDYSQNWTTRQLYP